MCAVGLGVCGVVQFGGFGEVEGDVAEGGVDFEHFSAIFGLGVFGWGSGALGNVAGGKVVWDFAGIKFVLKCYLHGILSEAYGAESSNFRVDPSNTSDEEVGLFEVEERRERQSGHCGGRIDFSHFIISFRRISVALC